MEKIKVSACIVSYNNADDIITAAESILKSGENFDFHLYISDNCSSDSTVKIAREKFKNDSRVTVTKNKENGGFGYGHNQVISQLSSKYHFIVNPDIIVPEDTVTKIVDFFEANSDVLMLCPKILNDDGTEQILPKRIPKFSYLLSRKFSFMADKEAEYTRRNEKLPEVCDIEFCTGCFSVIRTDTFKSLKGFDDRYFMYFEDADLTREVNRLGRVVMFRSCHVIHKWERASSKQMKFFLIQLSSMMKYFNKWKKTK